MKPSDTEVRAAIAAILKTALLTIRLKSAAGDCKECEVESDHVHNLPDLLVNLSDDLLRFYYDVERKQYLSEKKGQPDDALDRSWTIIKRRLE
jgi:hypothetical protein